MVVGNNPPQGGLATQADVTLTARQVYPSTDTRFTLDAGPGTLRIQQAATTGDSPALPLSAGGALNLRAGVLVQAGVLRAPQGQLALSAADSLTLAAGSETSVAGTGATLPWGTTTGGGATWVLQRPDDVRTSAPDKRIDLQAPQVTLAGASGGAGAAVVSVAGGGNLQAHEFVPGPGGSQVIIEDPSGNPIELFQPRR